MVNFMVRAADSDRDAKIHLLVKILQLPLKLSIASFSGSETFDGFLCPLDKIPIL